MPGTHSADPLVIRQVAFMGGMAAPGGWRPPPELPEVAFGGRSNVGKSALINTLVRRRALARVSNTPGRTREINFFRINDDFVLVDLPGYGYAQVSKADRARWRPLIESYLRTSAPLRGFVQLLDVRREPTDDDHRMFDFLADLGAPTIVAVTKVDKLKRSDITRRIAEIARATGLDAEQLIPFSAVTGEGRDELADAIVALIAEQPWRVL